MCDFESSFEDTAQDYHIARPGYPAGMYNDIVRFCKLGSSTRVLEIGAGTGIATKELARFGCDIVAVEPGEKLSAIARQELAEYPNVKLVPSTFEDFAGDRPFDIIFAATAFHWLDSATKYEKCDGLLVDNSYLVLAWNNFCVGNSAAAGEISQVYDDFFPNPGADISPNTQILAKLSAWEQEIQSSGKFFIMSLARYLSRHDFDRGRYLSLLGSFSNLTDLSPSVREAFLTRILQIIDKYQSITVPVLTSLYICAKTGSVCQLN
jgi:SAM-dependent methyltransferase